LFLYDDSIVLSIRRVFEMINVAGVKTKVDNRTNSIVDINRNWIKKE